MKMPGSLEAVVVAVAMGIGSWAAPSSLPPPPPAVVPAARALATVPFELHGGLAYVDLLVNGKPAKLVIDSAANHPALDFQRAVAVGLNVDNVALQDGPNAASAQQVRFAENVTYRIGEVEFTSPVTVVYSFEFLARSTGQVFQGVMGGEFFRQFVVEIDYPKRELRIHRPEGFRYSGPGKTVPLTVTPEDLAVSGAVLPAVGGKQLEGRFSLDTGAGGADVVLWKTCTAGGEAEAAAKDVKRVDSVAFGGSRAATQGRLEEFRMGPVVIRNPLVRITDVLPSPAARLCGNVGSGVFERFNVIFDAPHGRLMLE